MVTTSFAPFSLQLHNQTAYDNGVSRQLLVKDEKRQAILVCLPAGTHLLEHVSRYDGFITVIEGRGSFRLGDQTIDLAPGVFLALPAQIPHELKALENLAFLKVVDRHDEGE